VLPFGPKNGPVFLNRQMTVMLKGLTDTSSIFDDLATYSKSFPDFIQALRAKFNRIRKHGIRLDPTKCFYGFTELDIFGYHVKCGHGTSVQSGKIDAIRSMATPRSTSDVRKFLGSILYYSYKIHRFADIAGPLKALLKDEVAYTWGPAQQRAMDTLKAIITLPTVMAAFNPDRRTQLHTDASNIGLDAVLQQIDESGNTVPVAYARWRVTLLSSRSALPWFSAVTNSSCISSALTLKSSQTIKPCLKFYTRATRIHKLHAGLCTCRYSDSR
jgi:hypothetical protein